MAARRIPTTDTTRIDLLRRIAHAIIWIDDVDSALVLGQSLGPWRREVQTDATCRLLADDRFDDAYQLVRRFPNEDRDWALANLAVRLVRPLQYPRPTTPDTIVSATLHDRALAVAREIRSPEPRVDAFLEIANRLRYQRDTARARAAVADALASLPGIRDRDLASRRLRIIIDHLGSTGYRDSALALRRSLLRDDRIFAARGMGWWPNARNPRIRAELLGDVSRVDSVADARVQLPMAEAIVDAFKALGDSVTADSVATRLRSDPSAGRKTGQRATATLSVVERAVQLAPNDFRAAVALVDTLDDPLSYGRRARAFARVALAASRTNADTAALLLRRARELALARGLSTRQLSLTLLEIARELDYLDDTAQEKARILLDEEGRMLWVLMQKLGTRHWN